MEERQTPKHGPTAAALINREILELRKHVLTLGTPHKLHLARLRHCREGKGNSAEARTTEETVK